jgi:hypothetical protein
MNANAEVRNNRLLAIWRDLTTEPVWKYEELPPLRLPQLTNLDFLEASDSELARAIWFWRRRPKLIFHDNAAPIIVMLCVFVSLFIALANWPGTSMPKRVVEMVILLLALVI